MEPKPSAAIAAEFVAGVGVAVATAVGGGVAANGTGAAVGGAAAAVVSAAAVGGAVAAVDGAVAAVLAESVRDVAGFENMVNGF